MSLYEYIKRNERRLIFLVIIITCLIPAYMPLGFPLPISKISEDFYGYVEGIEPRSTIVIVYNAGPATWVEVGDGLIAVTQHAFNNDLRVVFVSFVLTGPPLVEMALGMIDIRGAEYGVDYVNLGYIPGAESGMAAFAENPHMLDKDFYDNPIDEFEIMSDVVSIGDFKAYIFSTTGVVDAAVRQFSGKVPAIFTIVAPGAVSLTMPWIDSGQLTGGILGLKAAAEYELLLGSPGGGVALMDATALTLSFAILLIVLGNVVYFYENKKRDEI